MKISKIGTVAIVIIGVGLGITSFNRYRGKRKTNSVKLTKSL